MQHSPDLKKVCFVLRLAKQLTNVCYWINRNRRSTTEVDGLKTKVFGLLTLFVFFPCMNALLQNVFHLMMVS